jgi:hypothetical protein
MEYGKPVIWYRVFIFLRKNPGNKPICLLIARSGELFLYYKVLIMDNAKKRAYQKIEEALFLSKDDASRLLSTSQVERKQRWMLCVSKRMENPLISDRELVEFLTTGGDGAFLNVKTATAYRDVAAMTKIFGNIQLASKAWYRYMIVEGAKEAYAIAKAKGDAKGMAAALDKIGKYTRTDKADDYFDPDKMYPPNFEPSDDPSVIGADVELIENPDERRRELRELFHSKKYAEDAKLIIDDSE